MKYYTTRNGDSIYRLAVIFYFRAELWTLMYFPNIDTIGNDPHQLSVGLKLLIPDPPVEIQKHIAVDGDSSLTLSKKYYGVMQFYRFIDEENDCPPSLIPGNTYIIPALVSQVELDAARDLRREISVEFDR
ncbi:MAG TPA: hypothetical protein PKK43_11025 [Spirochaetota bacterium]|nr:hypothetical protein [Spirochaetota bacterium]